MATHEHPAGILEFGLQDNCERCAEHAKHPFESLDNDNLRVLAARTLRRLNGEPDARPRSMNEQRAMRVMETAILQARVLRRLGVVLGWT